MTRAAIILLLASISESSFMLNRSAEIEGGVLLAVTLAFEGRDSHPEALIQAARKRLKDLLERLDIIISKGSEATS